MQQAQKEGGAVEPGEVALLDHKDSEGLCLKGERSGPGPGAWNAVPVPAAVVAALATQFLSHPDQR